MTCSRTTNDPAYRAFLQEEFADGHPLRTWLLMGATDDEIDEMEKRMIDHLYECPVVKCGLKEGHHTVNGVKKEDMKTTRELYYLRLARKEHDM